MPFPTVPARDACLTELVMAFSHEAAHRFGADSRWLTRSPGHTVRADGGASKLIDEILDVERILRR